MCKNENFLIFKVDQRGFPEMHSVTEIMTENIMDPELQDFVEESILECFQYLQNNRNEDKCKFSQNLLTCLSDKGREVCRQKKIPILPGRD